MDMYLIVVLISLSLLSLSNAATITCPKGEINLCESGCVPTCENILPLPGCNRECIRPCSCGIGYIREHLGGNCVPIDCGGLRTCSVHEVFVLCVSGCEPICNQPDSPTCVRYCRSAGCVCEAGYIKESKNGRCISQEECSIIA